MKSAGRGDGEHQDRVERGVDQAVGAAGIFVPSARDW